MVGVALHTPAALPFSDSCGTETLELVERRAKALSIRGGERSAAIEVAALYVWDCRILGFAA